MPFKLNPITSKLDYYEAASFRGVFTSAPSNPKDGYTYINSTDHGYYIYYGSTWQLLHTLEYVVINPETGNPIGLLLSLTYTV